MSMTGFRLRRERAKEKEKEKEIKRIKEDTKRKYIRKGQNI